MAYKRKTTDLWHLLINYGDGWEYVFASYDLDEVRARRREYEENTPEYPTRIALRKERISY